MKTKKISLLIACLFTAMAVFSQSNYTLKFDEKDFTFSETKDGFQIEYQSSDYYLLEDTTLPALPYKNIYILIAENVTIENLKVTIKSEEKFRDIHLVSNPAVRPTSQAGTISKDKIDNYEKEVYPDKNIQFETIVKSQGFYMATFSVCPFVYHAQKQTLEFITEMSISFEQNKKVATKSTSSDVKRYDMKDVVKSMVINPDDANVLYSQQKTSSTKAAKLAGSDVEYLIITDDNLKAKFAPLKTWKIRKGVKTEILSTAYIYANYTGVTNQLKIKKCLRDYYENRNLKWVLLGGDNTVVPVQGCYGNCASYVDSTMPCDLFYACFDNAFDWDANGNGVVGEPSDDIDMAPEIYISRAPVRTTAHVTAFVNKTLAYETNPPTANYVKKILLTGTHLWDTWNNQSDAHQRSERMYDENIAPFWNGTKHRFYDTGTDFSGGASYDLTATKLQSVLDNGYHFVHMATHGGSTSWSMETGTSYSSTNAGNQTNSKQSIIVTMACNTNAFDKSDPCLSEAFIRNPNGGSVLYWGSSTLGWGFPSLSTSLGPSFQYNAAFYNKLFNGLGNYKFAAITSVAKVQFIASSRGNGANRWLQFSQNAIGDPELSIYTENPVRFSNASALMSGSNVTISTGGIANCTIALTSADDGKSYFSVAENASSHTFTNVNPEIAYNVTISKHNYIPYLKSIYCPTVNYTNRTINGNATIEICNNINVQNIVVNATLTIKAAGEIRIQNNVTINKPGKLILETLNSGRVIIDDKFDLSSGDFEVK